MLYNVGGRRLFLEVGGEGSPTVVLEAGAGNSSTTWDHIWLSIMAFTRVCRYDRPNLGQSDRDTSLRSLRNVVEDLHALLKTATVPGPYIMVGHSFGGLVVRLYAHCYPEDVVGLVLIDSSHPEQRKRSLALLPPQDPGEALAVTSSRTRYSDPHSALAEGIDFSRSLDEAAQANDLGSLPVTVISRSLPTTWDALERVRPGLPPKVAGDLEALWQELQFDLVRLSAQSTHLVVHQSGHDVHHDQPCLVAEAIRQVVIRASHRP